jgi:hypothetical protein
MKQPASRAKLLQDWRQAFGSPPPSHLRENFLELAIGWQKQMQNDPAWRGKAGRLRLKRLLQSTPKQEFKPGSRLVREWHGTVYQVSVLSNGFELNGKTFKSLSAIARHITGTPWSGPKFFGLVT